jgi:O-methyltransferase
VFHNRSGIISGRLARLYGYVNGLRRHRKYRRYTMLEASTYSKNLMLARKVADIDGCVVECGTWKGGMLAGIAEVLGPDRRYFGFDSFEGLPPAKEIDGNAALAWQSDTVSPNFHENCRASVRDAEAALKLSGAKHVELVAGWFDRTLPSWAAPQPIALLRLDADWYDSTRICLDALMPQMAAGGLVIVDDYYTWDGCARAVHDWITETQTPVRIRQAHNDVCYFHIDAEVIARLRASSQPRAVESEQGLRPMELVSSKVGAPVPTPS